MDRVAPSKSPETKPLSLSVVVATYNRAHLLPVLLKSLSSQTLAATSFDVVLVDDGSKQPVGQIVDAFARSLTIKLIEQQNAGQAAARDRGVQAATGDIIVVVDDDMVLANDFLERHLAWHRLGYRVVLGRILSSPELQNLPLFERFHADQLEKFTESVLSGKQPRGTHVCTGNLSFRRADYLAVGGFDRSLLRSEDRDLGIRLEILGAPFVFGYDAQSTHDSDHASLDVWLRRAYNYGMYDAKISDKHPSVESANPWQYFFMVNPLTRPIIVAVTVFPILGKGLSRAAWKISEWFDDNGFDRIALRGATLVYGVEYFRGMRTQAGSLARSVGNLLAYVRVRAKVRPE